MVERDFMYRWWFSRFVKLAGSFGALTIGVCRQKWKWLGAERLYLPRVIVGRSPLKKMAFMALRCS
ncbi:hypothetical protein PanWU01x14_228320 [Parasponia andersonii]|uniref:Uncharacterized protein n=1 Tax=Parasponia andersonii TaxID=3476 RepID=A0A2P5BLK4_PARAD|nr:hypothetical protein PanWU01x14_228320 [Parasponia andersonii]